MRIENPSVKRSTTGPANRSGCLPHWATASSLVTALICCSLPAMALDANNDGISDVWASLHPVAANNPAGDDDGDGVSNAKEAAAWTDPSDPASCLKASFEKADDTLSLDWPTERWNRYRVMRSDDLTLWTRDGVERLAGGTPMTYAEVSTGSKRFLHIQKLGALNSDTDALSNLEEEKLGTNPETWDSDGDKVGDDDEFLLGTNPLSNTDSDSDGLPDDWETWIIAHDPNDDITGFSDVTPSGDFDNDQVLNGTEFSLGTNPVVPRRNIIYFMSEDHGFHLGCYGTVELDTPKIDSFATMGALFTRAFSASPVCSPAKMALLTGTYPHTNAGYRNTSNYDPFSGGSSNFPLTGDPSNLTNSGVHEDLPTIVEILKDRGWYTMVTHKTHVEPIRKFPWSRGGPDCSSATEARSLVQEALANAGGRPVFLYLNLGSPHIPFRSLANSSGFWNGSGGLTGDGGVTNVNAHNVVPPNCYPNVDAVKQDFADYYGSIEVIDGIYDAAVDEVNKAGEGGHSIFLYTGDHGMGLHRAKQSCYGMAFHVPLLIHGEGIQPGLTISAPVSHIDLAPTFLQYGGIPLPPSFIGKSLWPILSGSTTSFADRKTILTASHHRYDARAVTDGHYYYIRNLRQPEGSWANPEGSLNADQYTPDGPYFVRTYDATKASPQSEKPYQFLDQIVNGKLPAEELYDMDGDLWMTENLITDPTKFAILRNLRAEMTRWRNDTEDYNSNNIELKRRTERYVAPITGIGPNDGHVGGLLVNAGAGGEALFPWVNINGAANINGWSALQSPSETRTGNWLFQYDDSLWAAHTGTLTQSITSGITGAKPYTANFWISTDGSTAGTATYAVTLTLRWYSDTALTALLRTDSHTAGSAINGSYQQLQLTGNTPAGALAASYEIKISQIAPAGGTAKEKFRIDDCFLSVGSP